MHRSVSTVLKIIVFQRNHQSVGAFMKLVSALFTVLMFIAPSLSQAQECSNSPTVVKTACACLQNGNTGTYFVNFQALNSAGEFTSTAITQPVADMGKCSVLMQQSTFCK